VTETDQPVGDIVRLKADVLGFEFLVRPPVTDGRVDEHTLAGEHLQ